MSGVVIARGGCWQRRAGFRSVGGGRGDGNDEQGGDSASQKMGGNTRYCREGNDRRGGGTPPLVTPSPTNCLRLKATFEKYAVGIRTSRRDCASAAPCMGSVPLPISSISTRDPAFAPLSTAFATCFVKAHPFVGENVTAAQRQWSRRKVTPEYDNKKLTQHHLVRDTPYVPTGKTTRSTKRKLRSNTPRHFRYHPHLKRTYWVCENITPSQPYLHRQSHGPPNRVTREHQQVRTTR